MASTYQTYRAGERETATPVTKEVPLIDESLTGKVNTGGQGIVLDSSGKTILESPNKSLPTGDTTTPEYQAIYEGTNTPPSDIAKRESAYNILYTEFAKNGLGALVADAKAILMGNTNYDDMSRALEGTKAYQQRFSANQERIAKGLMALSPSDYIKKEDAYQNVMRNYGLPASYYTKGEYGKQAGFDQLLANDVSAPELEDRIMTAQNRVLNANPEVAAALKAYYPDITNGDILAYALDPKNAIQQIKSKVTAAEIGGAMSAAGLESNQARAEMLRGYGITGQQYAQSAQTIADLAQRGSQLASIYGETPYTQQTAEQELLNLAGGTEAARARKKLTKLETAAFSGSSGTSSDALSRDRALSNMQYRSPGAGAF